MPPKPPPSAEAAALRQAAEAQLKEQHPDAGPDRTEADTQRLVHELQVHQIELELQNEELRRARDDAEAAMEKYSDLYDFAPVGYLTLDREGTVLEANLAGASLLGVERARLIASRLGLFLSAGDRPVLSAFLTKVFAGRGKAGCEVTLPPEGPRPLTVWIEAEATAAGRECRAALTDITERQRAEADRLLLRKMEAVGILAGSLAQDYSSLITTILVNLDMAQTLVRPGEEFLARRLQEAELATLQAQDLTRRLVTVARQDVLVRKVTPLSGIIHASVEAALSGSPVRCEYSLPEGVSPVEVDVRQIGLAIRNVVFNAREAMPRGGVLAVRTENVVLRSPGEAALPPGAYVRLSITDQGAGIAREALPKVFDACYSTKPRSDHQGMGLGLTMCQAIVKEHGGTVMAESAVGVGTTLHLYLPAVQSAEDGGQRTEDGGQRTEDRGQRSEDRGQRVERRAGAGRMRV
jgi:signal transduction histidine kinase